jgi:hypothetical protein
LAIIYCGLRDKDEALFWLERAYNGREHDLVEMLKQQKTDTQAILEKLGSDRTAEPTVATTDRDRD